MIWHERAKKNVNIRHVDGYIWVSFSPAANGMRWGDKEFDDFIEFNVSIYEERGWQLIEYTVSNSGERISLRFKDTRRRRFQCRLDGEFSGQISEQRLVQLLKSIGIDCKIEEFKLC